jgi:hypothetical protein
MRTTMFLATLLGLASLAHAQTLSHSDELGRLQLTHKSYIASHNERVMYAFLRFTTQPAPELAQNRLEVLRDRDRLQLYGAVADDSRAGYGVALFGAFTVLAAHAPGPVRALFDGPVHFGPALFDNGGMGAGIGGRFL